MTKTSNVRIKINKMEVKKESLDSFEKSIKVKREPILVNMAKNISSIKQNRDLKNILISPTGTISTVKEEPHDEVFLPYLDNIREVKASEYFVNTSDLINITQGTSEFDMSKTNTPTTLCDSVLKNEKLNNFDQPCSSEQAQEGFKIKKTAMKCIRNNQRNYPCLICRKRFQSHSSSRKHFNFHFKEKCIMCPFCGKFFLQKVFFFLHYFSHLTKINLSGSLNCKICFMTFKSKNEVQKHFKQCKLYWQFLKNKKMHPTEKWLSNTNTTHFLDNVWKCEICLKKFTKKGYLERHLLEHEAENMHKCELCFKTFKTLQVLRRHLLIHGLYECEVCSKYFPSIEELQEHINIHVTNNHAGKKTYKCETCFKIFNNEDNFKTHKVTHDNGFDCKFCSHKYRTKAALTNHLKVHDKPKDASFECDVCSKKFSSEQMLNNHLHLKHIENAFTCQVCFKSFKKKQNLKFHILSHTGQRPIQCALCSAVFTNKTNLTKHLVSHTTTFDCKLCNNKYKTLAELNEHITTHHQSSGKYDFTCKICFINIKTENGLIRHLSTHLKQKPIQDLVGEYKCQVCSVKFKQKEVFEKHNLVNKVTEGSVCTYCSEPLILKCHEMVHTMKERYPKCDRCFTTFCTQDALTAHYKEKHENTVTY